MLPVVLQAKFATYLSWSQPFLYDLLRTLEDRVTNVVMCSRVENLERFPLANVVRLGTRHLIHPTFALLAAAQISQTWKPQILHAHFGWSGIRVLLLKQCLGLPLVTTFGGRDISVQMGLPYLNRLYRLLLEHSDQIICVSRDLHDQVVATGVAPDRVTVIRRGTDLRAFAFVDRSARGAEGPLAVLMAGRLVEKKGHRYAFEAVAELLRRGYDVRLTILGEGALRTHLAALRNDLGLERVIEFAGVTDHDGVRRHMTAADVFVHCSVTADDGDREGIPNVVIEAAATGLPVVGTRHGGLVEAVKDERTGLLVAERDVAGLSGALARLAASRDERLRMGREAARMMREDFDLASQVDRHLEIYRRLAAGPPPRRARLPSEYPELWRQVLRRNGNSYEFSIAELLETAIGANSLLWRRRGALRPFAWQHLSDSRRWLPQHVRDPARVVVRQALLGVIRLRQKLGLTASTAQLAELDRLAQHYLGREGRLDTIHPDWSLPRLAAHLGSKIEPVAKPTGAKG